MGCSLDAQAAVLSLLLCTQLMDTSRPRTVLLHQLEWPEEPVGANFWTDSAAVAALHSPPLSRAIAQRGSAFAAVVRLVAQRVARGSPCVNVHVARRVLSLVLSRAVDVEGGADAALLCRLSAARSSRLHVAVFLGASCGSTAAPVRVIPPHAHLLNHDDTPNAR